MDKLTEDVIAAEKAGMSYGKWKAMQPEVNVVVKFPKGMQKPKIWRKCGCCGKDFYVLTPNNKKYCSDVCYRHANGLKAKERYYKKKEN